MLGPIGVVDVDTRIPDDLLDELGRLKLKASSYWDELDSDSRRLWAHKHARYGLPTVEMVAWLQSLIGTSEAIEIGSGHGDLCHHLGIRGTDNYQQLFDDVALHYALTRQPTIQYPKWVERIDALSAVVKYRPDIVIGSWITQWADPNLPLPAGGGNPYGVMEDAMLDMGITYVLIGNVGVHGGKEIVRRPHKLYDLPFNKSRSAHPDLNRVWVWEGRR